MNKKITFLLLFTVNIIIAQSISGKIVDNNNQPLPSVDVVVKGTTKGASTDFDGKFEITNIAGKQTLVISSIGYKTKEVAVTTPTDNLAITLYEGNELLQEVVVASRNNSFSRKKTAYVAKLPLKDIENANVYSTVTTELLESQIVTDLDQAMANATGVYKLWEGTGRNPGNGTSYYSTRGFSVQPKLIDGIAGITFSAVEPSYLERIEVVKGPTATLFGSTETSLGGLINVVTKKPFKGTGGSVSYTIGSFGLHRGSLDYNTPLGKDKKAYFRVNSSYLTQDSFQDAGFKETFFFAPSISFNVSNKFNISTGLEFSKTKQTNPSMLFLRRGFPLVSKTIAEMNVDPTKSYTSNDLYLTNPVLNARIIGDYKISDKWTSQTILSANYGQTKGDYQYQFDGGAGGLLRLNIINQQFDQNIQQLQAAIAAINDPNNPQSITLQTQLAQVTFIKGQVGNQLNPMLGEASALLTRDAFTRVYSQRNTSAQQHNIQQNFTGDFKIGSVRNRMVIGLDFLVKSSNFQNKSGFPGLIYLSNFPQLIGTLNGYGLTSASELITSSFSQFPYFDAFFSADGSVIPSTFAPNATYRPSKALLDANFANVAPTDNQFADKTFAAYVSDVINITPALTVSVGMRFDRFMQEGNVEDIKDNYNKTTFSPSAGILYQPILNKVSVFANYQTGFVNNDPDVQPNGKSRIFQPTKAKQFEGGVKTNLFGGRLNVGASYYQITANDFVTSDPSEPIFPVATDVEEVVSKGFEIEMNATPFSGLNIRASFSKNDMEYTNTYSEKARVLGVVDSDGNPVYGRDIVELKGRRPVSAGADMLYNFWADYKFPEGTFAENFGIGAGFNGASEHLTTNDGVTGTFTLPSFTIFNAGLYYNAEKFRVGVKANNFTDETYYTGWSTINAQAPRSFLGTFTYKF